MGIRSKMNEGNWEMEGGENGAELLMSPNLIEECRCERKNGKSTNFAKEM